MSENSSERFRQILEAARKREGGAGIDTMLVNSHLAQMKLFMLRQGLEFYPVQDTYGFRKSFLSALIESNEVDARLEGIVDDFCLDGKGLWFARPVKDSYRLMWFSKENYRAYYDAADALEEVDLIYSFRVRQPGFGAPMPPAAPGSGQERFVRLQVRKGEIIETISNERPSFDPGMALMQSATGTTRTVINTLGFVPAVEAFNTMRSTGMDATGDFDWLSDHILTHDDLVKNIRGNIEFFGNPTLFTSLPRSQVVESGGGDEMRPTISSQAGFYASNRPSTRVSQPLGRGGAGRSRIPRVVSGVEGTDRAIYITPDAVSGDQNLYARQYREEVRTALGGVDELGISSGATAYEVKSLYGRAATTATRKCRGLLSYGLCKLLAMIIQHEEYIFRESFASAAGIKPPALPVWEELQDQAAYDKAVEKFYKERSAFDGKVEAAIGKAVQAQKLPPGVMGLVPDGDPRVEWRWTGPVFEESAEDMVQSSIVVRNLQELGVSSIQALRYLFPDKTDEERASMLNGFPFRVAQQTQQSIGSFLAMVREMANTPHPQAPDLPLLADPKMDLTPYLYRALDYLKRELTYAGIYSDAAGSGDVGALDSLQRGRAERGLPVEPFPVGPSFLPDGTGGGLAGSSLSPYGAPGSGSAGQSLAGGIPATQRQPERDAQLPSAGTYLARDPAGSAYPGSLSPGSGVPGGAGGVPPGGQPFLFGAADLGAPGNAGLLGGPVPGTGARRVPVRRQRRKP